MTALPEHLWPQVKVKADAESPHVTLVEVRPPEDATSTYTISTLEWARKWPTEEVWKARLRS